MLDERLNIIQGNTITIITGEIWDLRTLITQAKDGGKTIIIKIQDKIQKWWNVFMIDCTRLMYLL